MSIQETLVSGKCRIAGCARTGETGSMKIPRPSRRVERPGPLPCFDNPKRLTPSRDDAVPAQKVMRPGFGPRLQFRDYQPSGLEQAAAQGPMLRRISDIQTGCDDRYGRKLEPDRFGVGLRIDSSGETREDHQFAALKVPDHFGDLLQGFRSRRAGSHDPETPFGKALEVPQSLLGTLYPQFTRRFRDHFKKSPGRRLMGGDPMDRELGRDRVHGQGDCKNGPLWNFSSGAGR